jgi:hypothetical protein
MAIPNFEKLWLLVYFRSTVGNHAGCDYNTKNKSRKNISLNIKIEKFVENYLESQIRSI